MEPREKLARRGAFREIIVRADFEPGNLVRFIAARGEHEHGHIARAADFSQHLEAIEAGQHHIENDGVPRLRERRIHARRAGVRGGDGVAEGREVIADERAERAVVVDDEDARTGRG